MRLRTVKSVIELGEWMQLKGYSPGEHPRFGGVHDVHTPGSLHYGKARNEAERQRLKFPGLALDVNDRDVTDTRKGQFKSEGEALKWLYMRILQVADDFDWPLDEMFFDGYGFIKERGFDFNHAITGHDGHLHVGFERKDWR